MNAMLLNLINSKEVTWVNVQQCIFIHCHCQLHLFYLLIHLIIVMQHYCHSLSSSAFVSSPLYGPSCFPVIISSVSVSLVLIMSQVSPVMSPYISLFYPMLPVDYC